LAWFGVKYTILFLYMKLFFASSWLFTCSDSINMSRLMSCLINFILINSWIVCFLKKLIYFLNFLKLKKYRQKLIMQPQPLVNRWMIFFLYIEIIFVISAFFVFFFLSLSSRFKLCPCRDKVWENFLVYKPCLELYSFNMLLLRY
jgi:hypothetical protein